nr:YneF family protein [Mycoplasmopsis pullorum]
MTFGLTLGFSILGTVILTGIVTFLVTKKIFEKQLRENPPITEKMIRVMFQQMGRKASETQIKQVMRSMNAVKEKN